MTSWWQELANSRALTFIPIDATVLDQLEREYHWPRAIASLGGECMQRSKEFDILAAARECLGSYDEWPCPPSAEGRKRARTCRNRDL
jgi:hypothetical protein